MLRSDPSKPVILVCPFSVECLPGNDIKQQVSIIGTHLEKIAKHRLRYDQAVGNPKYERHLANQITVVCNDRSTICRAEASADPIPIFKIRDIETETIRFEFTLYSDQASINLWFKENSWAESKILHWLNELEERLLRILTTFQNPLFEDRVDRDCVKCDVRPFNKLFYRECFYQSLIPALSFFDTDYNVLIANSFSIYAITKPTSVIDFSIKHISARADAEVLHAVNIDLQPYKYSIDICNDVSVLLASGHLVIAQVDCYYLRRKTELYMRVHGPHSLLITGFDREGKTFDVIDNRARLSIDYISDRIAFSEFEEAYNGFNNQFNSLRNQVSIHAISILDKQRLMEANNPRALALACYRDHLPSFVENEAVLEVVCSNFSNITSDQEVFVNNAQQLMHAIGESLIGRRIELYKAREILRDSLLSSLVEKIVEHLELIHSVVAKVQIAKAASRDSIFNIQRRFEETIASERQYLQRMQTLVGS
jgi:hypothetical protein